MNMALQPSMHVRRSMRASPWLVHASDVKPLLRLYCFPHAGGQAGMFMNWQQCLGPSVGVCGVELPGRGTRYRERPLDSIESVVEQVGNALSREADVPFALFGHSLGALIAFEVSRYLVRTGKATPAHLFVSACGSPDRRDTSEKLHLLPDDELLSALVEFDGTPQEVLDNAQLLEVTLPIVRADFRLSDTYIYKYEKPIATPMTVLAGLLDKSVSADRVGFWAEQTTAPARILWLDGGHFFIHTHRTRLLKDIGRQLSSYLP